MGVLDEWWSREQRKKEIRDHQLQDAQSRFDKLQDAVEKTESDDYSRDAEPCVPQKKSETIREWLSRKQPDENAAYLDSIRDMESRSSQRNSKTLGGTIVYVLIILFALIVAYLILTRFF